MPNLDDPLRAFEPLRQVHARLVKEYFDDLVRRSGIDTEQNARTVSELRQFEDGLSNQRGALMGRRAMRVAAITSATALTIWAVAARGPFLLLLPPAIWLVALVSRTLTPRIRELAFSIHALSVQRDAKAAEAASQMQPLNRLYTWDAAPRLFQQAVPAVKFDRFLSLPRLSDFDKTWGLLPELGDHRSVLSLQSGTFRGNPFVFLRYLQHWMGSQSYTGSISIEWTEQVRASDGTWVAQHRSQTLTASVVKPCPRYLPQVGLFYAHEAAPNLSFSRRPSRLSGLDDSAINNWRKEHAVRNAERHARRDVRKNDGQFTVMANTDFEALFQAKDRDNEIEFRFLFTPLAQQEMVTLLNDSFVGYGDDFAFSKEGMINVVEPRHLLKTDFAPDPRLFSSVSLAEARTSFARFQGEYFKSLYFSFAPLWTVPAYHQERSLPDLQANDDPRATSSWDHEVMANYIGQNRFRHPNSVTENILKTTSTWTADGTAEVQVTSFGYDGIPRVTVVPVRGGDGNIHSVPVNWTEYIPVTHSSAMFVNSIQDRTISQNEADDRDLADNRMGALQARGLSDSNTYIRSGVAATLLS